MSSAPNSHSGKLQRAPNSRAGALAGRVYLVGAGPGDPGLITVRGAELLATADLVLHDELVDSSLLGLARGEVRFVGKRGGDQQKKTDKQAEIERELIEGARAGKSVVRLKGGDPFLFGRGSEEAEALAKAGVPFEIVPGVPSPLGATAYAGISVTHRELASSVAFVSGTTRAGEVFDFAELASFRGTLCVLMGMKRIEHVARALIEQARRDESTPAAVIHWGTRASQRVVTAPLASIAARAIEAGLDSPAIIVVGDVVKLRDAIRWFDARPLFGKRVLLARPEDQIEPSARAVRRRGAQPIGLPAIVIGPSPEPERVVRAVRELATYDLVVFTSENGVARFFDALDRESKDARAFGAALVAAIGPSTAAALATRGVRADLVPARFVAEALLDAILAHPTLARKSGARVLLARALVAREVLPDELRARGFHVDVVPVYETRSNAGVLARELQRLVAERGIDVVLLGSSSTADAIADALGEGAKDLGAQTLVASIGPITTKRAEERGIEVRVTAETSTIEGLLDAVERTLGGNA